MIFTEAEVDAIVNDPRHGEYHGWHDEHPDPSNYYPAIQQARAEFMELLHIIQARDDLRSCLNLGLGSAGGMHRVFCCLFADVLTIEFNPGLVQEFSGRFGVDPRIVLGDSHDPKVIEEARSHAPYDFLFVDANHLLDHVSADYANYAPMVRPGGLIAFHDSIDHHNGFEVCKFLEGKQYKQIGSWLGIALMDA